MSPSEDPRVAWETRYATTEYFYGTEPNDFLRERLPAIAVGRALCLAEGEGRNAVHVAAAGHETWSVDLTEAGVAKTRRLAAERGVRVEAISADLAHWDLGAATWDLVVSVFAHLPPPVRSDLHRRVVASLRPGGVFLLEAYTPDQIGRGTGGPPVAELTMTLESLREELVGLEIHHGVELLREVVEGSGHTGTAAVVQLVAVKPGR
ncbi:MAG: class I SAM-dependent methyltransferase [Acidimicrobiales bacterium]|nr:class I SAM-dependent methyltransferase [Acidimicrobiales bacterium]